MAKKTREPNVSVTLVTGEVFIAYETYGTAKSRLRDERAFVELTVSNKVARYKVMFNKSQIRTLGPIIKE